MSRKVNVFGIPMETMNTRELLAQQPDGEHVKLVIRVEDEVVEPYAALAARRHKVLCDSCQAVCWNDPLSSLYEPGETRLCIRCVVLRAGGEAMATQWDAELAASKRHRDAGQP